MRRAGCVYLVGAGPGDPGLLTLRAAALLSQADVVVYDHLVDPRLLERCRPGIRRIYVGKEPSRHTMSQEGITRLLVRLARAGGAVVRLKGGDPMLFGRGGEEALGLAQARVPFEVVPGVTSALAVPAYAGIPVTHRRVAASVAIVTGHEAPGKPDSGIAWDRLATGTDTLVVLMGMGTLADFSRTLMRHGRPPATPCAVIAWGSLPRQRTVIAPLRAIASRVRAAGLRPPAVCVIGEVVALRRRLAWFERRPLFGRRILVTRAADKGAALADRLETLGAEVERVPAIALAPVPVSAAFRRAVARLPETAWVFFTSPEGIGWCAQMLRRVRRDLRWLKGCHIGAIGPKTAEAVEAMGLHVDFVPRRFSQDGMVADFPRRRLRGARGVIFSARETRDVLARGLRRQGMQVERVAVYQTVMPTELRVRLAGLCARPFDAVTATSASCVDHVAEALRGAGAGRRLRALPFATIGPVTSRAVRARGGRVAAEAKVATMDGLLEALQHRWGRRG